MDSAGWRHGGRALLIMELLCAGTGEPQRQTASPLLRTYLDTLTTESTTSLWSLSTPRYPFQPYLGVEEHRNENRR